MRYCWPQADGVIEVGAGLPDLALAWADVMEIGFVYQFKGKSRVGRDITPVGGR